MQKYACFLMCFMCCQNYTTKENERLFSASKISECAHCYNSKFGNVTVLLAVRLTFAWNCSQVAQK